MPVSMAPRAGSEAGTAFLRWRGLGCPGDLDLNFSRAACAPSRRGETISATLFQCTDPAAPLEAAAAMWRMTLTARIAALLTIWWAGSGQNDLEIAPACPENACGERMELSLPVEALFGMAEDAKAEPQHRIALSSGPVTIRRPTGADQRAWQEMAPASLAEAALSIALSLVVEGEVSAGDREALSAALAEFDPLPCFTVETVCPHCSTSLSLAIDLEGVLLAELGRQQAVLITQVHHLAQIYGWREADVLAIPGWRRQRYMALAQEQRGWP